MAWVTYLISTRRGKATEAYIACWYLLFLDPPFPPIRAQMRNMISLSTFVLSAANVAIAGFEGVSEEEIANFAEVPMRTTMCTRVRTPPSSGDLDVNIKPILHQAASCFLIGLLIFRSSPTWAKWQWSVALTLWRK